MTYSLEFTLESDAIFARGDGVSGLVDIEVQHDRWGFPFLGGRALKGLLAEACADILAALGEQSEEWERVAAQMFGVPGEQESMLSVGDATLPEDLRTLVAQQVENGKLTPDQVLESLTAIRRQTAMEVTGVPKAHTLRSIRVILRNTTFQAPLFFKGSPSEDVLALLAVCIKALRRAGSRRTRGFGRLKARLLCDGQDVTQRWADRFYQEIGI